MNNVSTPMIVWFAIASIAAFMLVARLTMTFINRKKSRMQLRHIIARHHIIEIGDVHDEFYVPGDEVLRKLQEYDADL